MTSPSQCESARNFWSLCRSHWRAISTSQTPPEQEVSSRKVVVAMEAPNITKSTLRDPPVIKRGNKNP